MCAQEVFVKAAVSAAEQPKDHRKNLSALRDTVSLQACVCVPQTPLYCRLFGSDTTIVSLQACVCSEDTIVFQRGCAPR